MDCPACSGALSALQVGDIHVDVCRAGCGGVWLDRDELLKLDEPHEFPESELFKAIAGRSAAVQPKEARMCPRCPEERLVRQFIDHQNRIEIDQCWECSGIWLDAGELAGVRGQFKTYEERKQAVAGYVETVVRKQQQVIQDEGKARLARYEEDTSNRFKAGVYFFKRLLGLTPDDAL